MGDAFLYLGACRRWLSGSRPSRPLGRPPPLDGCARRRRFRPHQGERQADYDQARGVRAGARPTRAGRSRAGLSRSSGVCPGRSPGAPSKGTDDQCSPSGDARDAVRAVRSATRPGRRASPRRLPPRPSRFEPMPSSTVCGRVRGLGVQSGARCGSPACRSSWPHRHPCWVAFPEAKVPHRRGTRLSRRRGCRRMVRSPLPTRRCGTYRCSSFSSPTVTSRSSPCPASSSGSLQGRSSSAGSTSRPAACWSLLSGTARTTSSPPPATAPCARRWSRRW